MYLQVTLDILRQWVCILIVKYNNSLWSFANNHFNGVLQQILIKILVYVEQKKHGDISEGTVADLLKYHIFWNLFINYIVYIILTISLGIPLSCIENFPWPFLLRHFKLVCRLVSVCEFVPFGNLKPIFTIRVRMMKWNNDPISSDVGFVRNYLWANVIDLFYCCLLWCSVIINDQIIGIW